MGEEDNQVEHLWLPQPRRLGGQLPAGYGWILLSRHGGGDAYQELVARMENQLRSRERYLFQARHTICVFNHSLIFFVRLVEPHGQY